MKILIGKKQKHKSILLLIILIFLIVLIAIFIKFEYKIKNSGNNNTSSDKINILNISSYNAKVLVEVHSNRNINKYLMKQEYKNPNTFIQEVIEPSNIKGLKITCKDDQIKIENQALNYNALYEHFQGEVSNLNLISFIEEYKEGTGNEVIENDNEIVMKTKISKSKNRYQMYQNLYIDKNTDLPTKMEILDINKNVTVYILYNEISLNK